MNTKPKCVVFISLPMNGKTSSEIRSEIQAAKRWYLSSNREKLNIYDVAFVTNLGAEYDLALHLNICFNDLSGTLGDKDRDSIWMLGAALQRMAKADEILFWGQWGRARGCLVEHMVAKRYGIPITYGTDWTEELTDKTRDNLKSDSNKWPKDKKPFENANQLDKKYKEYADNRIDVPPYSNLTKRCEEYERAQKELADFWGSPKDELFRSVEVFCSLHDLINALLGEDDTK